MAMDPNKLAALVEEQSVNPLGDLPMPEAEGEEETEGTDNLAERGDELLTSMGEFGIELKESADIMLDSADELGEDVLAEEPSPETEELALEQAERMPPFMQEGFAEHLADKPPEDLEAVGAALDASLDTEVSPEGEYTEEVAKQVGGMLGLVAKCCVEGAGEGEEEEEEEEEEAAEAELPEEPLE